MIIKKFSYNILAFFLAIMCIAKIQAALENTSNNHGATKEEISRIASSHAGLKKVSITRQKFNNGNIISDDSILLERYENRPVVCEYSQTAIDESVCNGKKIKIHSDTFSLRVYTDGRTDLYFEVSSWRWFKAQKLRLKFNFFDSIDPPKSLLYSAQTNKMTVPNWESRYDVNTTFYINQDIINSIKHATFSIKEF